MIRKIPHWVFVVVFFAAATFFMTYPMMLHWATSLRNFPDPSLNAWLLAWNTHALTSGFDLRDASIFYPLKGMLFLSESLLPQTLLFAPVYLITKNAVAGHNFVLFLSIFLNGYCMYLASCSFGHDRRAAVFAGTVYAFCPYFIRQLNHVQTLAAFGLPLFFLSVHRLFHTKRVWYLFAAAVCFALQSLMHGYHVVYLTYFGGLYLIVLFLLSRGGLNFRHLSLAIAAGLLVTFLLIAWYIQYQWTLNALGLSRWMDLAEVVGGSADLLNFLGVPPENRLYGRLLAPFMSSESALFPGLTVLLLVVVAILKGVRGDLHVRVFLALLLLSVALSWGPFVRLHGQILMKGPYWFFADWLPGWSMVRAPGRLGVVYFFFLAALSGWGLTWLLRRFSTSRWAGLLFVTILSIGLLEYSSRPIYSYPVPSISQVPDVFKRLSALRAEGPAVVLPTGFHQHPTVPMSLSIPGFIDMPDGYSGYVPSVSQSFLDAVRFFPSNSTLKLLEDMGIRFVVLNRSLFERIRPNIKLDLPPNYELLQSAGGWDIYRVPKRPRAECLVGSEQVVPGATIGFSLISPRENFCDVFGRVEFRAIHSGISSTLTSRQVGRCLPGKDGLSVVANELEFPKDEGTISLVGTIFDRSGEMISELTRSVAVSPQRFDSRDPGVLLGRLESIEGSLSVAAGETIELRVSATNIGNTQWFGDLEDSEMEAVLFTGSESDGRVFNPYDRSEEFSGPHFGAVHLILGHWRRKGTPLLVRHDDGSLLTARGYLGANVAPGEKGLFVMRAKAPSRRGRYLLRLSFAAEYGPLNAFRGEWSGDSLSRGSIEIDVK